MNKLSVSGIYTICCLVSNKIYVGSSENILRRWNSHKSLLKRNVHKNAHLQSAYNKYGKDSFEIKVIELCSSENLIERETYWIDQFNSKNREAGYNQEEPNRTIMSEETKFHFYLLYI